MKAQETTLHLDEDLHEFFLEVVEETLRGRASRLDPVEQEYLLGLLEDSAVGDGPLPETLGAPLAVQLSEALYAPAAERFTRLRRLGDGMLLLGGLYEPHLRRRGLQDRYVITLGRRAYSAASNIMVPSGGAQLLQQAPADILGRLAARFGELIALLRDISDTLTARAAVTASDLAQLCERWLDRRSDHLTRLLALHGIQLGGIEGAAN